MATLVFMFKSVCACGRLMAVASAFFAATWGGVAQPWAQSAVSAPIAPTPEAPPISDGAGTLVVSPQQAGGVPWSPPSPEAIGQGVELPRLNDGSAGSPSTAAALDPPGRVGRVSLVSGEVSLQAARANQWAHATLNRPLTTGDSLYVGADGQAELHLGGSAVRLGPNTTLRIVRLDDTGLQLALYQGSFIVKVHEIVSNEMVEIDLPRVSVTLLAPGAYRADVAHDLGETFSVRGSGTAEALTSNAHESLSADKSVHLAPGADARLIACAAPPNDALDAFYLARDEREQAPKALQYVSRDTVGYEELDGHGSWAQTSNYGSVWYPNAVAADWAPYRYGHWVFISPWGWTWVDDAAWGFAPFHYGRWVYWQSRWGWAPGPLVPRPIFAPALVGFVGGGMALGLGLGAVGWCPLGFGEPYRPWYHTSYFYMRAVNHGHYPVTSAASFHVTFVNRGVGITATQASVVQKGMPVGVAHVAVAGRSLPQAALHPMLPPAEPVVRGFYGQAASARPAAAPPAHVMQRPMFSTQATIRVQGRPMAPTMRNFPPHGQTPYHAVVPPTIYRTPSPMPQAQPLRRQPMYRYSPAYRPSPTSMSQHAYEPSDHFSPAAHFGRPSSPWHGGGAFHGGRR